MKLDHDYRSNPTRPLAENAKHVISRASVLLSEGRWFDSPGLHAEGSLDKILNPKTAPDVLVGTLHVNHRHQCMNQC